MGFTATSKFTMNHDSPYGELDTGQSHDTKNEFSLHNRVSFCKVARTLIALDTEWIMFD